MLTAGSKSVRFFLPLCGKAGDLLHLYNEGHTVTGVEGVPFVVEQFFRENKLDYEKVSLPEIRGWKYKVEQSVSQSVIPENQTGPPRCRGYFRGIATPALLCHKEPARRIESPRLGARGGYFAFQSP